MFSFRPAIFQLYRIASSHLNMGPALEVHLEDNRASARRTQWHRPLADLMPILPRQNKPLKHFPCSFRNAINSMHTVSRTEYERTRMYTEHGPHTYPGFSHMQRISHFPMNPIHEAQLPKEYTGIRSEYISVLMIVGRRATPALYLNPNRPSQEPLCFRIR